MLWPTKWYVIFHRGDAKPVKGVFETEAEAVRMVMALLKRYPQYGYDIDTCNKTYSLRHRDEDYDPHDTKDPR
jgi:hypothetical protein